MKTSTGWTQDTGRAATISRDQHKLGRRQRDLLVYRVTTDFYGNPRKSLIGWAS